MSKNDTSPVEDKAQQQATYGLQPQPGHGPQPQAAYGLPPHATYGAPQPAQGPPPQATYGAPQPAYGPPYTPVFAKKKEKVIFTPDANDFYFAIFAFVLGYLCSRWVVFSWLGWGVALFTMLYLLTVTVYFKIKGALVNSFSVWFWFTVTLLLGASYALFDNNGFYFARAMFLLGAAIYYVVVASGRTIKAKNGNYLLIDGLNASVIIPFRNFINQYLSFSYLAKGKYRGKVLPVIFGIIIAIVFAAVLIPMLRRADSGGFGIVLKFISDIFDFRFAEFMFYAFFAIPIAAFIYGLVSGSAHGRHTDTIKPESAEKKVAALRFAQSATVFIVLGTVCVLYLVFIFSQMPYFFSAFTGNRPEGWFIYAEYARHGFFELCGIAAINLAILTVANITSKKQRVDSSLLKVFNIILALITLVLIATAFSKMAMYIDAYGLTMPRLLPCVFMAFLAVVFIALIVLQKWDFSIVRFALVTGAVMFCALCLSNPDALAVRYNTNRFMSGTLKEYDVEVLYRSGMAGVSPAYDVLGWTDDLTLRREIFEYLNYIRAQPRLNYSGDAHRLSLDSYLAREMLISTAPRSP